MNEPEPRPIAQQGLALKWNNTVVTEHCALCDALVDTTEGWTLFVDGTWDPVCDACAQRQAPGLLVLRNSGYIPSTN